MDAAVLLNPFAKSACRHNSHSKAASHANSSNASHHDIKDLLPAILKGKRFCSANPCGVFGHSNSALQILPVGPWCLKPTAECRLSSMTNVSMGVLNFVETIVYIIFRLIEELVKEDEIWQCHGTMLASIMSQTIIFAYVAPDFSLSFFSS